MANEQLAPWFRSRRKKKPVRSKVTIWFATELKKSMEAMIERINAHNMQLGEPKVSLTSFVIDACRHYIASINTINGAEPKCPICNRAMPKESGQ